MQGRSACARRLRRKSTAVRASASDAEAVVIVVSWVKRSDAVNLMDDLLGVFRREGCCSSVGRVGARKRNRCLRVGFNDHQCTQPRERKQLLRNYGTCAKNKHTGVEQNL